MPPATAALAVAEMIWLTPEDVAEMYSVSPVTVRDWINAGVTYAGEDGQKRVAGLNGKKVGGRWRIHPDELARFINTLTGSGWESPAIHRETEAERLRRVAACKERLAERLGR
jgi:hypothetical protein